MNNQADSQSFLERTSTAVKSQEFYPVAIAQFKLLTGEISPILFGYTTVANTQKNITS
ncbi:hypothetical protein PN465_21525 [Nodularia spumigena CS-584]|uniref:Uncharacterized protein n=1 Tax=Nodularia spumigena UHCC 0060 TaxID=3110300 RepID=A0ABU5UW43_NODSP|nr:hypothetical protein [Nodularia spumigena]MDB9384774.1 hypothetical protein [Nodularia spumigena CS-584]MEA5527335.1 hypothetical protein [Nodularia spumigena UHCC 0143]MEA5609765.1 hypothetical protein [Nodularia spumigena UHCC 0060]